MKTPRAGSLANVCTEVSMPERTRKVPISDSENAMIASNIVQIFNASRFSMTTAEWRSAVPREPRHQGGILDRIPEPPAAPAELVIGPVRPHRDAEREEDPGGERPRPHEARPRRIDAALDQRRNSERK